MNGEHADSTTALVLRRREDGSSPSLTDSKSKSSLKVIGCTARMIAAKIILDQSYLGAFAFQQWNLLGKLLDLAAPLQ
jgi:hypothetical protein